ncbi:hypothetical protein PN478_17565 [Dolichospermum circinale CS-534/05]|jgi:hypothetical protein|uniref:hypothetical protein n=1 Tax=Dolichospermum circinale TaxID=109265 RepID=UPI00232D2934|nr:hypothetical protein [Dolichospermum circinale]MDB9455892.1 hypothetical protein [Dolichospermum circinale CS-541/06]MDB9462553.1 hypothetical protein [Dolichospermum circinale CS-541/04]MDB9492315.1 hypothetical protein [Dolichospermum circinale CS-534/05]MDB9546060.1 hypothetical protein [Dolichospermum circinale CS-1031]
MQNQNPDPLLTVLKSKSDINELDPALTKRVTDLEQVVIALYQEIKEIKIQGLETAESNDWVVRKVRDLEYRYSRREDLEYLQYPFSSNGDANCNW